MSTYVTFNAQIHHGPDQREAILAHLSANPVEEFDPYHGPYLSTGTTKPVVYVELCGDYGYNHIEQIRAYFKAIHESFSACIELIINWDEHDDVERVYWGDKAELVAADDILAEMEGDHLARLDTYTFDQLGAYIADIDRLKEAVAALRVHLGERIPEAWGRAITLSALVTATRAPAADRQSATGGETGDE